MTNIAEMYLRKCEDYKHGRISLNELLRFHDKNRESIIKAAADLNNAEKLRKEEEVNVSKD